MRLREAHALTHLALHEIHVRLCVAMIFLMPNEGILLTSRQLHFFLLRFFIRSASALRAPPFPETKLLTLPMAQAAIGTFLEPLDR